jgi:hypothetical protein
MPPTTDQLKQVFDLIDRISGVMLDAMCKPYHDGRVILEFWLDNSIRTEKLIRILKMDVSYYDHSVPV